MGDLWDPLVEGVRPDQDIAEVAEYSTDYDQTYIEDIYMQSHRIHHHARHLSSHNTLDYCTDPESFDILNLHSYDAYDWFLFIFSVLLLNGLCFGCGCVGYRLTFTSGSEAAALIRQITSPNLVSMETPQNRAIPLNDINNHYNDDCTRLDMEIDANMAFEVVATPSKCSETVFCKLPIVDRRSSFTNSRHYDRNSLTRRSFTGSSAPSYRPYRRNAQNGNNSVTSLYHQHTSRYSSSMGNLTALTRGITRRTHSVQSVPTRNESGAESTVNEATANEETPNSSDSSRTHLTWIRAGISSRSVSADSSEMNANDRAFISTPPVRSTEMLRMNTMNRRSKSNLSKLEPIDESFERGVSSGTMDSMDML